MIFTNENNLRRLRADQVLRGKVFSSANDSSGVRRILGPQVQMRLELFCVRKKIPLGSTRECCYSRICERKLF